MIKLLATLFVLSLAFLNQLGTFWFVYGVWPKSWSMFISFFISQVFIYALFDNVKKENLK